MSINNKLIILSSNNNQEKDKWDSYIIEYFNNEPMMKSAYLELFAEQNDRCYCALLQGEEGIIAYPFIVRAIPGNEELYDTTTPYGYGGPTLMGSLNEESKQQFWSELQEWFTKEKIVSEFIRFALYNTENTGYIGSREQRSLNIVRKLNMDLEEIWYDFEHKVRKNIKKAIKNNLTVQIDLNGEKLEEFLEIYYSTMDRRDANDGYYFKREFFESIHNRLKDNFAYFYVIHEGKCISAELVLYSEENIYSYLGGTLGDYFAYRPNDLLKYEVIKWGNENKINQFILGGGYGSEDGIFKYKKSFAPNGIVDFYIGTSIYNIEAYNRLSQNANQKQNDNLFFPIYRKR